MHCKGFRRLGRILPIHRPVLETPLQPAQDHVPSNIEIGEQLIPHLAVTPADLTKPNLCSLRTEFFKPEKGRYLHPTANRVISHREAARIQSFPDDFVFEGTKIEIARQTGNAVPPLLGKAIAEYVHEHAFGTTQST